MSQIVAPGTAQDAAALASSVLPSFVGQNLFDISKVTAGMQVNASNGLLSANVATNASGLIYCPGATSMAANLPISVNNGGTSGVCLYDANGAFISVLPSTVFQFVVEGCAGWDYAPFTLPGTQTYVRFCYVISYETQTSNGWASDTVGMVYATITGAAALPGTYQPGGLDSVADVNTKIAAAIAARAAVVDAGMADLEAYVVPSGANLFSLAAAMAGYNVTNADGSTSSLGSSATPTVTGMIYCPGATWIVTNGAIPEASYLVHGYIQLFDATGAFTGVVAPPAGVGYLNAFVPTPLPGTQCYARLTIVNAGSYLSQVMIFAGRGTVPAANTVMNGNTRFTPYFGPPSINNFARTTVKKASELGCALNCDDNNPGINPGNGLILAGGFAGQLAVDDTTALNAFLATATATNPIKLILDGFAYTTGLVLSAAGNTTIEGIGWGSGIYVLNGSNQDGIRIGAYTAATQNSEGVNTLTPPARAATDITLSNFTIDANAAHNNTGGGPATPVNQPVSGSIAHCTFGAILANCTNVAVDRMNFLIAPEFALAISNANAITVTRSRFTSGTAVIHDGVHIYGWCEDIAIGDCYFATGDDAIGLNAPEGYGGDISRVTVTNCIFNGSLSVMRVYPSVSVTDLPTNYLHKIRNVVVSNCTGYVRGVCFSIGISGGGWYSAPDADQIQDLSVSNCTFSAPLGLALIYAPIGSISFRGIKFIPTATNPVVSVDFSSIGELVMSGVRVLRNPDGNAAPSSLVYVYTTAAMDRITISDFALIDEEGRSYTAMPALLDMQGTVAAVRLDAVDLGNITALVSSSGWTHVTKLLGSGVMGTGAQVPDSVMDSNALYLSSTASGAPSIKVGGTAKRFTLV